MDERDGGSRITAGITHAVALLTVVLAVAGIVLVLTQHYPQLAHYTKGEANGGIEDSLNDHAALIGRAVSSLLFAAAGWYLQRRRPGVIFGPLFLAAGLGNALTLFLLEWSLLALLAHPSLPGETVGTMVGAGFAVEPLCIAALLVLFPDGVWPRGIAKPLGMLSVGLVGLAVVESFFETTGVDPHGPLASLHNPIAVSWLGSDIGALIIFPALLLANVVIVIRWLTAPPGDTRRLLRALVGLTVLTFVLDQVGPFTDVAATAVLLLVVIAGVLRYRVYGIQVVLNRTLVYVVLTGVVAATYGVLVALVNVVVGGDAGTAEGLVPALGAAFILFPARQRVQRVVNRVLYGQRDEPYAVVSSVGAQLEASAGADQLLPGVLASIVDALRLPYAAIELPSRRFEHGEPNENLERFAMVHGGDAVGELIVARRSGETTMAPSERRLLEDVARQAAVAAANLKLTEELVRSRERIINAAEEERRRLRRDLHDGLGPVLIGAATLVDAARNQLGKRDTDAADALLADVRGAVTTAVDDLRRLVYALRPPALDQLGLLGALREHMRRSPVPVVLHFPDALPDLPPAVEVAAYRIVTEAVTNVARHAHASSCSVAIACNGALRIEVNDDGHGAGPWSPGVGLSSMRERAVELGGRWEAGPCRDGPGGRVVVELPIGEPA